MNSNQFDVIIIGGGAAGFFAAINLKEKKPELKITILEKGNEVLQKVKISGGGRCNLTNRIEEINHFLKNYPRGEKELRSCFQQFGNRETIQWFESNGIELKTEGDGRVFPKSNSSQTIIDFFYNRASKLQINILLHQKVINFAPTENLHWKIRTESSSFTSKNLVVTTGSNIKIWDLLKALGHNIILPVPSLFSFNIEEKKLNQLMGISQEVTLKIKDTSLLQRGNILITHWGISGPAVLKLSAFGAKYFFENNYRFTLSINWLSEKTYEKIIEDLKAIKQRHAKKNVLKNPQFGFTHRLWEYLIHLALIPEHLNFADASKFHIQNLARVLTETNYSVSGKSTFKDEFVTAGGVDLKEINFKTMESKLFSNLFFAGEILNVDGITGGFNFQNAWTGAWIVSESIKNEENS